MKIEEVPQDNNPTYQGYGTRAVYAVSDDGRITKTRTSGWEVEEVVLRETVAEFEQMAIEAKVKILNGELSPIAYFMHKRFLDVPLMAQALGLSRWRVRRHLKPRVFQKLSVQLLQQYAELFRIHPNALTHFKEDIPLDPDC